jgi:uncharacterized repeat protein (TIGR01451 family)
VFTSTFWKRAALGTAFAAALLSALPSAMAEGRFRLPYGDGFAPPGASTGRPPHGYTPPPLGGRFGPPGSGAPGGRVSADLQLSNTAPNPTTQGQRFDYTLTVTNAGPAPTSDVSLSDQLPEGLRLVQATPSQGVCSTGHQFVRCALDTLAGGHTATVTLTVNSIQSGTVYNTASVMGREYDPYEGNNTATAVTDVRTGGQYGAELSVTNTVDRASAVVGENLTYTITAANAGPAVAVGTHLSDQLPQGAELVSASPSQGACRPSTTDVACDLGDLASGAAATVTVVVKVNQSGSAVNVAYVTSRMLDENTGDNSAQATTEVAAADGSGGGAPGGPGPIAPGRPGPVGPGPGAGSSPAGPPQPVGQRF